MDETTNEKEKLNKELAICEDEIVEISVKVAEQ